MKKTLISLFVSMIILSALVSCGKPDNPVRSGFTASTTEYEKSSDKSTMDDFTPRWSVGDKICVWGSDLAARLCQTLEGDTTTAFFRYDTLPESPLHGPFRAVAPAELCLSPTRIILPPSQQSQTGLLTNAPMYARSDSTHLVFNNLCGVVSIRLTGEMAKQLYYVILTADQPINGEYDLADDPSGSGCPQLVQVGGGSNSTILNVTNATQGNGTYSLALPAGTYNRLAVYLYSRNQRSCSMILNDGQPVTVRQNEVTLFAIGNPIFSKSQNAQ